MEEQKSYIIEKGTQIPFYNHVDFCVGTGRMGLALQKEYQDQLALVQKEIGFKYIRGHGLFSDDMAIYHEYTDEAGEKQAEYNFTYLDMVMDSYLKLNIRPFLELGFMPEKMASGKQTIFYWKGNVTPPKSYDDWCAMVQAVLRHLMARYGEAEVVTWPVEVWNEPNLPGFWKDADMEAYFTLFYKTFHAIKAVDARFCVGGPAICGVMDELWIRSFLEFCKREQLVPDFITRHHYTTELPERVGHYGYAKLSRPEDGFANLRTTRDIIDSFDEFRGMKIHITEFNTSYIPNCPLHDTNQNAAYIAHQLSRLGDVNESYSYWTFGDIFEEQGVPFTPFHGGFGLVANGCIPKPTFWTFKFFKDLQGVCIYRSDNAVIVEQPDHTFRGVLWNHGCERKDETLILEFTLPVCTLDQNVDEYCCLMKTVDEQTCNPLKLWHDMGEPSDLSKEQTMLLRAASVPAVASRRIKVEEEKIKLAFRIEEFGVLYFEVFPVDDKSDRGYDFGRVMG